MAKAQYGRGDRAKTGVSVELAVSLRLFIVPGVVDINMSCPIERRGRAYVG